MNKNGCFSELQNNEKELEETKSINIGRKGTQQQAEAAYSDPLCGS